MIAVYAADVFPVGEDGALTLGLLFASSGIGAIIGPILANTLSDGNARALQRAIGIGFVIVAIWLGRLWSGSVTAVCDACFAAAFCRRLHQLDLQLRTHPDEVTRQLFRAHICL